MKNIIKQRHGTDCGVACIAMFYKISYEEAEYRTKNALFREAPISFMNNVEVAKVMNTLGNSPLQVYTLLNKVPAIITVPSLMSKKKFHYVYWDGKNIYDPSNYECYTTNDFIRDLPMADSIVCKHRIQEGTNLPTHLYSEFDWEFINASNP